MTQPNRPTEDRERPFRWSALGPEHRNMRRRMRQRSPQVKREWAEVHELGWRSWTLLHILSGIDGR